MRRSVLVLASDSTVQNRTDDPRRIFRIMPMLVFLATLTLIAQTSSVHTVFNFVQMMLRSGAAGLSAFVVCVAAHGFYRYLTERSPGL